MPATPALSAPLLRAHATRAAAAAAALLALLACLLAAAPAQATFAGGNGLILFNRGGNLFTATATGGSVKQLTTGGGITGAKWSPDGKSIAYKSGTSIVVRTYATGATRTVAVGVDSAPQWSPDGSRIAFIDGLPDAQCGEQAIYTVSAANGGVATKVFDPLSDNCPHGTDVLGLGTYTNDGHILVTNCNGWSDGFCAILLATTDGTNTYTVVARVDCDGDAFLAGSCSYKLHMSDARVGPGGNGVLFSGKGGYSTGTLPGSTPTPTATTPERVYAVDKAGTGLHLVSTAASGYSPTWSPVGNVVLFTQKSGSTTTIMKSGVTATSTATVLIQNASQADWQATH